MDSQLFFIGNKRSGTTALTNRLSLHPDLYVTQETNIIWVLYHLYTRQPYAHYPRDLHHSTTHTLRACVATLNRAHTMTPQACYEACQRQLIAAGTPWMPPADRAPAIIGDKSPGQHSEPFINDWLAEHFPAAHYIHIVRHPYDFVRSVPRLPEAYDLGEAYGSSRAEDPVPIIATWTFFERLALAERERGRFPIYTLRFEDFTARPAHYLAELWRFCGLSIPPDLQARIDAGDTFGMIPGGRSAHLPQRPIFVDLPAETRKLMERYGYAP